MKTVKHKKEPTTKLYNGLDIFVEKDVKNEMPEHLLDQIEKIVYPQAKAYGAQDGNSKRP